MDQTAPGFPKSLYAFVVSLCCDGMFMVPVDSLDAAEAIASLQAIFTPRRRRLLPRRLRPRGRGLLRSRATRYGERRPA